MKTVALGHCLSVISLTFVVGKVDYLFVCLAEISAVSYAYSPTRGYLFRRVVLSVVINVSPTPRCLTPTVEASRVTNCSH